MTKVYVEFTNDYIVVAEGWFEGETVNEAIRNGMKELKAKGVKFNRFEYYLDGEI